MDDNKFHGKPCVKCEGTLRYVSDRKCVTCQAKHCKKAGRKRHDLINYGTSVDNDKTARRRAAEERLQDEW